MFWQLFNEAVFMTNFDAKNQILINHKCVCGGVDSIV
jgi:hypothetical protein